MRKVEVFIAGCPICDETVKLINEIKCCCCDVKVYDIKQQCDTKECLNKADEYGIKSVPTIVVDGKIAIEGKPTIEELKAVGIGVEIK